MVLACEIVPVCTENVLHFSARPEGQVLYGHNLLEWVRTFSFDVRYYIDNIITEGEKVAVRMTQSGTHTGTVRSIPH